MTANTFSGNTTSGTDVQGGGAYVNHNGNGSATISDNQFTNNSTSGTTANGGGLSVYKNVSGTANIFGNIADANSAAGTIAQGIGIFASANAGTTVLVRNNTVANNVPRVPSSRPPGFAGIGSSTSVGGTAFVKRNVVEGNRGGIVASGQGLSEVNDNTITGNTSTGISLNTPRGGVIHQRATL